MPYKLAVRDGKLYAREQWVYDSKPMTVTNWWPLGISWENFVTWFSSVELAQKYLRYPLTPLCNPAVKWQGEYGWPFYLEGGLATTQPTFTETEEIPEPAQRGRKYPLQWKNGVWYKETTKGLVRLIVEDSQEPREKSAILSSEESQLDRSGGS